MIGSIAPGGNVSPEAVLNSDLSDKAEESGKNLPNRGVWRSFHLFKYRSKEWWKVSMEAQVLRPKSGGQEI
jgi:hypothetical protein